MAWQRSEHKNRARFRHSTRISPVSVFSHRHTKPTMAGPYARPAQISSADVRAQSQRRMRLEIDCVFCKLHTI